MFGCGSTAVVAIGQAAPGGCSVLENRIKKMRGACKRASG